MADTEIKSELASSVLRIEAAIGDEVQEDEILLMLTAMKAEIPVTAPHAGTVARILIAEGDTVEDEQVLLILSA